MGLDMYLEGNVYLWQHERHKTAFQDKVEKACALSYINFRPTGVRFELGYWRKTNAVHNWFVNNVQDGVDDCGRYYVDPDQLQKLIAECKQAIKGDRGVLSPVSGFFFGSTVRDEYYYEDLKDTIKICEGAIEFHKEINSADIYYSSSW